MCPGLCWYNVASTRASTSVEVFKIRDCIVSGPAVFVGFRRCSAFDTPLDDTIMGSIGWYRVDGMWYIEAVSFLVKTYVNGLFNQSDFSFVLLTILP